MNGGREIGRRKSKHKRFLQKLSIKEIFLPFMIIKSPPFARVILNAWFEDESRISNIFGFMFAASVFDKMRMESISADHLVIAQFPLRTNIFHVTLVLHANTVFFLEWNDTQSRKTRMRDCLWWETWSIIISLCLRSCLRQAIWINSAELNSFDELAN